jgi:hypothetical protein
MMAGRISTRAVLGGCVLGLIAVSVVGGFLMTAAEGVSYSDGLWIVLNVVTTIGFGEGPATSLGQLVAAGAFITAATCWLGIVSVAVEVALSRFERDTLVREALQHLARRRGPKLFHGN